MDGEIEVIVSDRDHPHYGERGFLTGKIVTMLWGSQMAEVRLVNCVHGTDGCFVSKGQVSRMPQTTKLKHRRQEVSDGR